MNPGKANKLHNSELDPASIIFQRLQNQEALREVNRRRIRLRLATCARLLWSERNFLVRLSMLGFLLGLLVAFLIPAQFKSTALIMPPNYQFSPPLAVTAGSAARNAAFAGFAGDLLGLKSSSDVFAGILRSRTVADEVIGRFNLKRLYGVGQMREARSILAGRVSVSVDRKDETITITATDQSPERARDIATCYIEQLNRLVSDLSTSSARRERLFLDDRLKQVSQELQDAEIAFSQFASKNSAVDIKEQAKTMLAAAATLQGQLISAQAELEGVRQIYSDSNVRVRSLKAHIAELQAQLGKLGGDHRASSFGADTSAADLYPSIRQLPLLGVTYADLYRRTKVQEAVFEVLTQEYELAKVQEAREVPTVKILDPPDLPEVKSFPPRLLISALCMLLSSIGGAMFLLVSRSWTEKNSDDLSKSLVKEIWIDLKEKRFLNSVNSFHAIPPGSSDHWQGNLSIASLLGLSNANVNRNGHPVIETEAEKTGR